MSSRSKKLAVFESWTAKRDRHYGAGFSFLFIRHHPAVITMNAVNQNEDKHTSASRTGKPKRHFVQSQKDGEKLLPTKLSGNLSRVQMKYWLYNPQISPCKTDSFFKIYELSRRNAVDKNDNNNLYLFWNDPLKTFRTAAILSIAVGKGCISS